MLEEGETDHLLHTVAVPDLGEGVRVRLVVDPSPREEMVGVVAELGRGERKVVII